MPTGYTAGIADGTITDFKTFIMRLVRGMGALVTMRDDPWDAPIPERFEPSDYHKIKYEEAKKSSAELYQMSHSELQEATDAYNLDLEYRKTKAIQENEELRSRYSEFLKMAKAWEGAPEGLKEFAVSQLEDSIGFDVSDDPTKYYGPSLSPYEWFDQRKKDLNWSLDYHQKEYAKEVERVEGRNEWLRQFRESLNEFEEIST